MTTTALAFERFDPQTWDRYLRSGVSIPADPTGQLRAAELFCGSGGLALGFRTGASSLGLDAQIMAAIDHDPEAVEVYAENHRPELSTAGSVSMLADFKVKGIGEHARFKYAPEIIDSDWSQLVGKTDVLLAGPPCQGHSNLNNHSRRVDPRNDLYLAVPAVAIALGASHVIIENVPSVVNDANNVVTTAVQLLLNHGFKVEQGVLRAHDLGWPQARERYFVVATLGNCPLSFEQLNADLACQPLDVMWALADLVDVPADDHMFREPSLSEENQRRINWLFDNDAYELALSERPECHQDGTTYTAVYGRMYPDRPSPTLTTGFLTPGRGRYVHPTRRRVMRPREAARLQGFPDTYQFSVQGGIPSSAKLVKWIGDAVPMPLGHLATVSALYPVLA